MNWERLLREESDTFRERLLTLKSMGESFTYKEISRAWGTANSNTVSYINDLIDRSEGLVTKDTSSVPYAIVFHWDKEKGDRKRVVEKKVVEKEVKEESSPLPAYISPRTYHNIIEYLDNNGIWDDGCELMFKRGEWDAHSQRGGLLIIITVDGLPTLEFRARFDNGLILKGTGRISTASMRTIKRYVAKEMEDKGHATIASYFDDVQ